MKPALYVFHSTRLTPPPGATVWIADTGRITGHGKPRYWWRRDYVCLHIVQSGCGTIETDDGVAEVGPGDMFCLWPGVAISYGKAPGHTWEVNWARVSGPGDVALGRACGFGESHIVHRPDNPAEACARFDELLALFQNAGDRNPHRALQILHGIVEACAGEEQSPVAPQPAERLLVARARHILDSDLHLGLNVTELADRLGVCRTTLFLAFREELGTTPRDYLAQLRMTRAKQLLRHTSYTLETISNMVGFSHPKSFLKRFRQCEGVPPGTWRRAAQPS